MLHERLLKGMQFFAAGQTLDGPGMSLPMASAASSMHEFTSLPSTMTQHPPHDPRSQISLVPVRSSFMRSASMSVGRGIDVDRHHLAIDLEFDLLGLGPEQLRPVCHRASLARRIRGTPPARSPPPTPPASARTNAAKRHQCRSKSRPCAPPHSPGPRPRSITPVQSPVASMSTREGNFESSNSERERVWVGRTGDERRGHRGTLTPRLLLPPEPGEGASTRHEAELIGGFFRLLLLSRALPR